VSYYCGTFFIVSMMSYFKQDEPLVVPTTDGRLKEKVDGEQAIVNTGQSICIKEGSRVRYSNQYEEECEYWSVCLPAFSIDSVNREES